MLSVGERPRVVRDCNVAVVGGAGFLGSHLVDHLIEDRGCRVWVIDNLCAGRREFVHPLAHFCHADITDSESYLYRLFKGHAIRYVFQYAAWPYIPLSFARPLHVFGVNATGALNVLNAAHEADCAGILQVSSAEIYGGAVSDAVGAEEFLKNGKLNELAPVTPHSSYGAAKAAIDAMVQVRWREARTPCIALRQFNCLGERETHPYVVPEIISQLSRQKYPALQHFQPEGWAKATVKLGNNSFRDFLYAGDAVCMAVELLEKGQFGEVYNLGSESGVKIYELAHRIGFLMGFRQVIVEQDPARARPWEIWHLLADNSKVYSVISTRPTVTLDEALRRTLAYFEANGRKWCWENGRAVSAT